MAKTSAARNTQLASELAAQLRSTFGNLKRKVRQQSEQNDFSSSQIAVILRIEKDGPCTMSSLARAEGMRPQSMSAVIAPLIEREFISAASDPSDGRKTLMSLTKACKKWMEEGRAARQDWLAQTLQQKLTSQEQMQLSSAMRLLARLTQD